MYPKLPTSARKFHQVKLKIFQKDPEAMTHLTQAGRCQARHQREALPGAATITNCRCQPLAIATPTLASVSAHSVLTMSLAATHAQRGLAISRQLLQRQHAGKALVSKIQERYHHPDPFNPKTTKGWKAALKEAEIPTTKFDQEIAEALELGLPGASSIDDKTIPTFSRGELPHFAGINTFLKAPYIEDSRQVGNYDCAVVGVPFDGGCTYRAGTRFGPQGIRRISALYTPYNYEKGIDLREQMVRQGP